MKPIFPLLLLALLSLPLTARTEPPSQAPAKHQSEHDEATRFIFYSVLEGLYEDGLAKEDVERILMKKEKQCYEHFIYACPICTTTIWALQAYQARPDQFYSMKAPGSTFGTGLSEELHKQLYSDDTQQRLIAINTMVKGWIAKRMDNLHLTPEARATLNKALEKKRQDGMDVLKSFRKFEHGPDFGVDKAAPAYVNLDECAVCNGAVGKVMKLPEAAK